MQVTEALGGSDDDARDVERLNADVSHRDVIDALARAAIVTSPDGTILLWNAAAQRLYGWSEPEVLGRAIVDVLSPVASRDEHIALLADVGHGGPDHDDHVVLTKSGDAVRVVADVTPVHSGSGAVVALVGLSNDVTDLRVSEQASVELLARLQLALDAGGLGTWSWDRTTGSTEWDSRMEAHFGLEPGAFKGRFGDWTELLHPDDRAETLDALDRAVEDKRSYRVKHRVVWPDGSVHWLEGAGRVLLDGAGEVIGAIGCTGDVTEQTNAEVAIQRAMDEARDAAARERHLRERLEYLTNINDLLNEASDRGEIMRSVTAAAVPRLGDWCSIYVLTEPGAPPEIEVAHVDPAMVAYARELAARFPYDPDAAVGVAQVIRTGNAAFYPEISDELLVSLDLDDEAMDALRRLNLRSVIIVPLSKQGRVVGAMQFVRSSTGRLYGPDDLALAQAVAGRIASSLENRRLTGHQRDIARTLQASLLPDHLPSVDGLDIAVRYWAAGEGTEVGGDFYDVFAIDDERFAVVVGDVCGNGPEAAAVTGLVRHNIRANAWHGDDPSTLIAHLNQALLRTRPDTFCTVAYAVVCWVPDGLEITAVSGGHPLPVLVRSDGKTSTFGQPGLLVGALEQAGHEATTTVLGAGDTVVFYTDGATDLPPPHATTEDELATMVTTAAARAASAAAVADELSAALESRVAFPDRNDDIALLVLRVGTRG